MQTLVKPSLPSQASSISAQPLRLIALGDSVVYGFGDPDGGGWVERLRRQWMLPDSPGHIIYNLGVRGDGVQQVAQRFEHEFRHRGELRNRVPDAILLSIGINDSARLGRLQGRNFMAFETFEQELDALLERAQNLCPVLFVGMTPVDEAQMPFSKVFYFNHVDQHRYSEATQRACLRRQVPYLDILNLWQGRGEAWVKARLCIDGLHPNSSGYQALLQDVLNWQAFQNLVVHSTLTAA